MIKEKLGDRLGDRFDGLRGKCGIVSDRFGRRERVGRLARPLISSFNIMPH